MSKMGRAAQWVQENGLENDPDALKKYTEHLAKQEKTKLKSNDGNKDNQSRKWKHSRNSS